MRKRSGFARTVLPLTRGSPLPSLLCALLAALLLVAAPASHADAFQQAQDVYTDAMMRLFDVDLLGEPIYREVIPILESAASLYRESGDRGRKGLGASWREIGRCYQGLADYGKAAEYYLEAHRLFAEIGETGFRREAALRLGDLAAVTEDHDRALLWYEEAFVLAVETEAPIALAEMLEKAIACLVRLGRETAARERSEEALAYATEAIRAYTESGKPFGIVRGLILRGRIHESVRRPERAGADFEAALAIAEEQSYRHQLVEILQGLSRTAAALGHGQESAAYADRAAEIQGALDAEEKARALRKADDYTKHVELFAARGDFSQAEKIARIALFLNERYGRRAEMIQNLLQLGHLYTTQRRFEEALEHSARALEASRETGDRAATAASLLELALCHDQLEQADRALEHYGEALELFSELGDRTGMARTLQRMGVMQNYRGFYEAAAHHLQESLALYEALEDGVGEVYGLCDLGNAYRTWGRYDRALSAYQDALRSAEELGLEDKAQEIWNALGQLYFYWGRYDEAEHYFRMALERSQRTENRMGLAVSHNNLALVHHRCSRLAEAETHYLAALGDPEILSPVAFSITTGNLGGIYLQRREFDKAAEAFGASLAAAEKQGYRSGVATALNNLAEVHTLQGNLDRAEELYSRAYAMMEEMQQRAGMATTLQNLGHLGLLSGDWRGAAEHFERSIGILEELRQTATGDLRRDYFASVLSAYAGLIDSHLQEGRVSATFEAMETSSAKYLAEQMGEKARIAVPAFCGIDEYRKSMDPSAAVLSYSRLKRKGVGREVSAVFACASSGSDFLEVREIDTLPLLEHASRSMGAKLQAVGREVRGFAIRPEAEEAEDAAAPGEARPGSEAPMAGFEELTAYYRRLLSRPFGSEREEAEFRDLSRRLYDLLIGPLESSLEGREVLTILPDSVLWLLPFETLLMPDGRYLVEKYQIRYLPSLSVSGLLSRRRYDPGRRRLLAFGGAVYDEMSYESEMVVSEDMLAQLQSRARSSLERGAGMGEIYHALDMARWSNLPGTLSEVLALREIVEDSTVLTGAEVTEARLKELSAGGELADYRIVHFATHGLAVPEIPELSAIVLSQRVGQTGAAEDGYLTVPEIMDLDVRADFLNLSACETGLGRLYGGEGVVGLAQAFLVAGANSLSVSLWQVADESTMQFMAGLYELVGRQGLGYPEAMTEMKRRFLQSPELHEPFYWAPFVYYGN